MLMHSPRLIAIFLAVAAPALLAQPPAVPVESSRELHGTPLKIKQVEPKRLHVDESCSGRLQTGKPEFSKPEGRETVRLPLTNLTTAPLTIRVATCFILSDGEVVPNPYEDVKGGFEGMSRGFLGVLSLGASEMAIVNETSDATIVTTHTLPPSRAVIVEHQLPFASESVVGSRSRVCVVTETVDANHAKEVRRIIKEQYWKVRDSYFDERLAETKRWEDLRNRLDKERASLEPLSDAYHEAMDAYWRAHQSHQEILASLEQKFLNFARSQEQSLRSALSPETP
ncbi:MAG: hypothetical protein DVB23_000305 [Verrucomicrobia bacterium]|jgi:hypothetical protein|nr:MAG: hypothetical protein DVB23_000305 [Verrucomicrobiota bacterium]